MKLKAMIVCLAGVAVVTTACGRRDKKDGETAAPGPVSSKMAEAAVRMASGGNMKMDAGKQTFEVKDKDGTAVRGSWNGTVPADFPKDIPVYKGAEVITSMSSKDGHHLTLKSKAAVADIAAFYAKELEAQGWEQESSMNMQGNQILAYKKDDRNATVMVNEADDERMIVLGVSNPPKSE